MSLFSIFSKKSHEPTSVAEALAGTGDGASIKSKNRRAESRHADTQNEQLIPEKKRARRRLVGAIAIVLAVVIGLPMVLDSEPKPLNKNIIIQIPSKDAPPILADITGKPSTQPSIAVADSPQRTVTTITPQPTVTSPIPVDTNTAPKPGKADSPTKSKPDTKSTDTRSTNNDESARAMAILAGADPAAKSTTRIVVQIGAFATQEKVNELQDKLNSAGIKSFTQKVATSSGDKIRVRVGPFSDKESADKVKLRLEKIGLNGTLIAL